MDWGEQTEKTSERGNGNKAQLSSLTLCPAQTQLLLRDMLNLTIIADMFVCVFARVRVCV